MFELIYYNQKGEVKSIEMLPNSKTGFFECTPQENYFVKGFTIKNFYLDKEKLFSVIAQNLSPLENHFLQIGYGFFPELTGYMFRNENSVYALNSPILNDLYKNTEVPKMK